MEELRKTLRSHVQSGKLPGALVRVLQRQGGPALVDEAIGYEKDAMFRMYSQTKVVTAVSFLILLERGAIGSVDDNVAHYLPAFRNPRVLVEDGEDAASVKTRAAKRPITLRHLLTHSSGITYDGLPPFEEPSEPPRGCVAKQFDSLGRRADARDFADITEYVNALARLPLSTDPGEKWQYGFSLDVVGRVIEVASGMPLPEFLDREIFAPLGMRATSFFARDGDQRARLVPFFRAVRNEALFSLNVVDGAGTATDASIENRTMFPCAYTPDGHSRLYSGGGGVESLAGGLVSTIDDWSLFSRMLLQGGELSGVRILQAATLDFATRDHLPVATAYSTGGPVTEIWPGGPSFCLLGQVVTKPSSARCGAFGWGGMGGTEFSVDPARGRCYLFMTQRWADDDFGAIWASFGRRAEAAAQEAASRSAL